MGELKINDRVVFINKYGNLDIGYVTDRIETCHSCTIKVKSETDGKEHHIEANFVFKENLFKNEIRDLPLEV